MGYYFAFPALVLLTTGLVQLAHQLAISANEDAGRQLHMTKKKVVFTDAKCLLCTFVMKEGLAKIKEYKNTSEVLELFEDACILLRMESPKVCKGGVEIFGKRAAEVIKKSRVQLSAEDACFLAFPDQCSIKEVSLPERKWRVKIPEFSKYGGSCGRSTIHNNSKALKALHISDIHVDMRYSPGSVALCGKPICCRAAKESNSSSGWGARAYSVISKFGPRYEKKQTGGAGKWGDYRKCDLPSWTLEHMLETVSRGSINDSFVASDSAAASQGSRHIDYIVWTGDVVSHDIWDQSKSKVRDTLKYLTKKLVKYFPSTKVFPVAGNHDSFPPNSFPPSRKGSPESGSDRWIYGALAEAWSPWLTDDALKTVRLGGYYTEVVYPGFRIVALNTNFCYTENYWVFLEPEDPGQMLAWFVGVLLKAEEDGDKVHVIGHVPPGRSPDCLESWSENYYRIAERFKCTITGQLFGHTHFDEFQLIYGDKDKSASPISVAYLGPSMTPYADMNPAFRIYDVDGRHPGSSWTILDHRTYMMNLEKANKLNEPLWELEYSAKKAYGISSLAPEQWHGLAFEWKELLESGDTVPRTGLLKYMQFFSRGRFHKSTPVGEPSAGDSDLPCETMECAKRVVCDIMKNRHIKFCSE